MLASRLATLSPQTFDRYGETLFGHPIGSIPVAEMGTVLRSIGQNPTETELANLCEEVKAAARLASIAATPPEPRFASLPTGRQGQVRHHRV